MLKFGLSFFEFNAQYNVVFFSNKGRAEEKYPREMFSRRLGNSKKSTRNWRCRGYFFLNSWGFYHILPSGRLQFCFEKVPISRVLFLGPKVKMCTFLWPTLYTAHFWWFFDYNFYLSFYMTVFMIELDSTIVFYIIDPRACVLRLNYQLNKWFVFFSFHRICISVQIKNKKKWINDGVICV